MVALPVAHTDAVQAVRVQGDGGATLGVDASATTATNYQLELNNGLIFQIK